MIDAEPDFRPKLPQVVDQLEVLSVICDEKCLGSGGQGVVFKGKFRGNDVAIKRIIKEDLSHSREANALNQLNHENVLKLLRSHDQGNFRYLPFFQLKNAILEKNVLSQVFRFGTLCWIIRRLRHLEVFQTHPRPFRRPRSHGRRTVLHSFEKSRPPRYQTRQHSHFSVGDWCSAENFRFWFMQRNQLSRVLFSERNQRNIALHATGNARADGTSGWVSADTWEELERRLRHGLCLLLFRDQRAASVRTRLSHSKQCETKRFRVSW